MLAQWRSAFRFITPPGGQEAKDGRPVGAQFARPTSPALPNHMRVDWVDIAKGICIILVVMLHATLGVEKAMGETSTFSSVIAWAAPFRMPDFFLISGLFLARRIDRPWRSYLDTKVMHFVYFYVLWVNIQLGIKAHQLVGDLGWIGFAKLYLQSYIIPFSSLWFIYILAIYFVITKVLVQVPKLAVFVVAAGAHAFMPETGIFALDQVSDRFVFFYAGYAAAPVIFRYAEQVMQLPTFLVGFLLGIWGMWNAWAVNSGMSNLIGLDLIVSFVGIAAVIAFAAALIDTPLGKMLRYCGSQSISIYLAFAIFMAAARQISLKLDAKFDLGLGVDLISLAALTAGVIAPLILAKLVKSTPLAFLFTRPDAFRLNGTKALRSREASAYLGDLNVRTTTSVA